MNNETRTKVLAITPGLQSPLPQLRQDADRLQNALSEDAESLGIAKQISEHLAQVAELAQTLEKKALIA